MSTENDELQKRIQEIKDKYTPELDKLSKDGKELEDDYDRPGDIGAVIGVDFKVDWKDVEISFDIPSITVEDKNISLDLPQLTSSRQNVSFDVPDTRMVDRKVGQYPEVDGWTVRWKDIIISVPEPYMRRVDIGFDLPSVTMKRSDFVIGLPRITMERVKWIVGLPQFTVVNVSAKTTEIQDSGKELQARGEKLAQAMRQEIELEVTKFKAALVATAFSTKNTVSNGFDQALGTIRGAIDELSRQGCDPIKVPTANGDVNLRKTYDDVDAQRVRAIASIDQAIPA